MESREKEKKHEVQKEHEEFHVAKTEVAGRHKWD